MQYKGERTDEAHPSLSLEDACKYLSSSPNLDDYDIRE